MFGVVLHIKSGVGVCSSWVNIVSNAIIFGALGYSFLSGLIYVLDTFGIGDKINEFLSKLLCGTTTGEY